MDCQAYFLLQSRYRYVIVFDTPWTPCQTLKITAPSSDALDTTPPMTANACKMIVALPKLRTMMKTVIVKNIPERMMMQRAIVRMLMMTMVMMLMRMPMTVSVMVMTMMMMMTLPMIMVCFY